MALGSLSDMKAALGITGTDATRDAALTVLLAQTEAAIKKLCRPFLFEAATFTDVILDAPWNAQDLYLPATPVRSITSLYYSADARGVVANFTSDHLLTAGEDYQLVIDDPVNTWSRHGRVRRLARSLWGAGTIRPYTRLAFGPTDAQASVKVTFVAGCTSVPAEVAEALYLATMMTYQRRTGAPVTSESWNGGSVSYAGPFTETAAVNSPDAKQLLAPYMMRVGVA
jgi:hypothetical protein